MKLGKDLKNLRSEIKRQHEAKVDYIADTSPLEFVITQDCPYLILKDTQFSLSDHAQQQIAEKVGIPIKYYNLMQKKAPDLLQTNVNHWFQKHPQMRMIRTLDGKARAFLSTQYHRMDNHDLANTVLPALKNLGAKVRSCEITENRMYLKAVIAKKKQKFGRVSFSPAISISNSEVGDGALTIEPAVYTQPCENMAVWAQSSLKKYHQQHQLRKYHLGRTFDFPPGNDPNQSVWQIMTNNTVDDFWRQTAEMVNSTLGGSLFDAFVDDLRKAHKSAFAKSQAQQVVEKLADKKSFTKSETYSILNHLIDSDDFSKFGLSNAITLFSQDVAGYDRASWFERIGGEVIAYGQREWQSLLN